MTYETNPCDFVPRRRAEKFATDAMTAEAPAAEAPASSVLELERQDPPLSDVDEVLMLLQMASERIPAVSRLTIHSGGSRAFGRRALTRHPAAHELPAVRPRQGASHTQRDEMLY